MVPGQRIQVIFSTGNTHDLANLNSALKYSRLSILVKGQARRACVLQWSGMSDSRLLLRRNLSVQEDLARRY